MFDDPELFPQLAVISEEHGVSARPVIGTWMLGEGRELEDMSAASGHRPQRHNTAIWERCKWVGGGREKMGTVRGHFAGRLFFWGVTTATDRQQPVVEMRFPRYPSSKMTRNGVEISDSTRDGAVTAPRGGRGRRRGRRSVWG